MSQANTSIPRKSETKTVPIALIWPNPDNPPGHLIGIQALADNMVLAGQRTKVKLVLLTDEEKTAIVQKEGACPYQYKLLGGHRRRAAALLLGWETLEAEILELTPKEAVLEAILDNFSKPKTWLDEYRDIESLLKVNPDYTQREIGRILGKGQNWVLRGSRVLKCLNPEARALIDQNLIKAREDQASLDLIKIKTGEPEDKSDLNKIKNGDTWEVGSYSIFRLTELENPDVVLSALRVVLNRKLNEGQTKKLVEWVKSGQKPEDFDHEKAKKVTASVQVAGSPVEPTPNPSSEAMVSPVEPLGADPSTGSGSTGPTTSSTVPTGADSSTESAQPKIKPRIESSASVQTPEVSGQTPVNKPNFIDEVLAGVSVIQPIRAKVKAGEAVSKRERLFLLACFVWGFLKWAWKASRPFRHWFLKALHHIGKGPAKFFYPLKHSHSSGSGKSSSGWEGLYELFGHGAVYVFCQIAFLEGVIGVLSIPFPGLKPWGEWLPRLLIHEVMVVFPAWAWAYAKVNWFPVAILGLFAIVGLAYVAAKNLRPVLFLLGFLGLAWYYGRSWSEIPPPWRNHSIQTQAAPIQPARQESVAVIPPPQVKAKTQHPHPIEKANEVPAAAPVAQVSISNAFDGDDEEKALLQSEIAAVPVNCIIEPFPVEPDSSIGQLMAVNRLGDLAVESEYSLRVGQGGQKITSLTPSATGVVIVTEGGLPLGNFLGGGSNIGFYWEDVQTINVNELDVKENGRTKIIYQCSLTATNLNQPLVVQCYTANNLKHLVSALEYFIKSAQGKYVPVTGMPYLNQGMVLGDENKITALWANGPADKAQLEMGDHVWSISGNRQQTKEELEAGLNALPSGNQTIEVVTPKDWNAEVEKEARLKSKAFHPFVLDFELAVP